MKRVNFLLLLTLCLLGAHRRDVQAADERAITLEVDATEAPRRIYHARMAFPVEPGPLTLYFPKWIPGTHGPTGPIGSLAGLKMTAAGKPVDWQRDEEDMYAFHCVVPNGAKTLDVVLDHVTGGRGGSSATSKIAVIRWNEMLLYPKGPRQQEIQLYASLRLPAEWKLGTALPITSQDGAVTRFGKVSLETLIDSPVICGAHFREIPIGPEGEPRPICKPCRELVREKGDATPIAWLGREERYVEKLATPDVTIADMIGDIDPIKAARTGETLGSELTVHYGLLPRANRGIFAINELPDLAGKIQVGLFNIMQEGDVQIKGYPVRLPLDIMLAFTANPEDYTARGKIITPLKDRIGSEIRTHYPATLSDGMEITDQESWTDRKSPAELRIPDYIREVIEQIAFSAREDKRVDKRSGVSQRLPISVLENVTSNAERRALMAGESVAVPRVLDVYAGLPSITGKLELEYEGELKGGDAVARELIRLAVGKVFTSYFDGENLNAVVQWFELGGTLKLDEGVSSKQMVQQLTGIQGLMEKTKRLGLSASEPDAVRAGAGEFILEGLYAHKRISRNEEAGFAAGERRREAPEEGKAKPKRQYQ